MGTLISLGCCFVGMVGQALLAHLRDIGMSMTMSFTGGGDHLYFEVASTTVAIVLQAGGSTSVMAHR